LLYSILFGRSNADMELLKKTYYKMYTDDLVSKVSGEVGGILKKVLLGSLQAAEEELDKSSITKTKLSRTQNPSLSQGKEGLELTRAISSKLL